LVSRHAPGQVSPSLIRIVGIRTVLPGICASWRAQNSADRQPGGKSAGSSPGTLRVDEVVRCNPTGDCREWIGAGLLDPERPNWTGNTAVRPVKNRADRAIGRYWGCR
jgi:hypothetical protein